jgi:hypothetical protein
MAPYKTQPNYNAVGVCCVQETMTVEVKLVGWARHSTYFINTNVTTVFTTATNAIEFGSHPHFVFKINAECRDRINVESCDDVVMH